LFVNINGFYHKWALNSKIVLERQVNYLKRQSQAFLMEEEKKCFKNEKFRKKRTLQNIWS